MGAAVQEDGGGKRAREYERAGIGDRGERGDGVEDVLSFGGGDSDAGSERPADEADVSVVPAERARGVGGDPVPGGEHVPATGRDVAEAVCAGRRRGGEIVDVERGYAEGGQVGSELVIEGAEPAASMQDDDGTAARRPAEFRSDPLAPAFEISSNASCPEARKRSLRRPGSRGEQRDCACQRSPTGEHTTSLAGNLPQTGLVNVRDLVSRFDRLQRRRRVFGFPLALRQKYADDQGGYLAAIVTYYAFLSLFPLLLVAATALGFVLRGHTALQQRVGRSVLGTFPIIGHDLRVHALTGSGTALAVGLTLSCWAGIRVFVAAERVMDDIWGIPPRRQPGYLAMRFRALLLALLLGCGAVLTTTLDAFGTVGSGSDLLWRVLSFFLSTAGNVALFWLAFRLLTAEEVQWRQLRVGAVLAALAWEVLQASGSLFVNHVVATASNTYGTFAGVIGLLSFIYLSVHIGLLAAETNVVATRRLWPRSLPFTDGGPTTDGDRRAHELREAGVGESTRSARPFRSR